MEEIGKKLIWFAVLLPGFVTVTIIGAIVDLGDVGEFSLTFYAAALTLLNDIIGFLIALFIVFLLGLMAVRLAFVGSFIIFAIVTLIISVGTGVFLGVALEKGTFFEAVRKIPVLDVLNKRSHARPLIFLLRQNTGGQLDIEGDARPQDKVGEAYLRVYLDDDVIYEGWPEFYDSKSTEVYLSPACKIVEDDKGDKATKIPGPGAIIPESEIKRAIFFDRTSSPCYRQYFPDLPPIPMPRSKPARGSGPRG